MCFVKAITRKGFHQAKNSVRILGRHLVHGCRTLHKFHAFLGHLFGFFLAHRAAQQVGRTKAIARQHTRHLHHLLLIHRNAKRHLQHRLQLRVRIIRRCFTQPYSQILRNQLHRPRAIQRNQRT